LSFPQRPPGEFYCFALRAACGPKTVKPLGAMVGT
jgi:hypothetical protein